MRKALLGLPLKVYLSKISKVTMPCINGHTVYVRFYGVNKFELLNLCLRCFFRYYLNEKIEKTTFAIVSMTIFEKGVEKEVIALAAWSMLSTYEEVILIQLRTGNTFLLVK